MIPEFLKVAYEQGQKKTAQREAVEGLKQLPLEELFQLANGQVTEKTAYLAETSAKSASYGDDWLCKYKGTPLFEKAVQIEQQLIQIEMQEQQRREAQRQLGRYEDVWDMRDKLCLQKRLLDLELAQLEQQQATAAPAAGGEQALEAVEGAGLDMAQQAHQAEQAQPKTASGHDRVAPKQLTPVQSEDRVQGAGALGSHTPTTDEPMNNVWSSEKQAAADKISGIVEIAKKFARADFEKMSTMAEQEAAEAKPSARKAMLAGGALGAGAGGALGVHEANTALNRMAQGIPTEQMKNLNISDEVIDVMREAAKNPGVRRASQVMGGVGRAIPGALLGAGAGYAAHRFMNSDETKEAFAGAMLQGLKGMGQFASQAGKGLATAAKGGMPQLSQALKNQGAAALHGATNFAKQQPLAAMGLAGGAGLAAGGLAGRASS